MKDPNNSVTIHVWGDYACFTRPEMKVERVSYPIMTPSAARGVLEAIYWEPQMHYLIDSIAVIKKGRWFSFRRNEVQKTISIPDVHKWMRGTKGVSYIEAGGGAADAAQRNMLALADVDYLITAEVRLTKRADLSRCSEQKYLDEIRRRASRGKCCHRPALGCREFAADFEWTETPSTIQLARWSDEDLGLMLYDVFDPALRAAATDDNPHVRPGAVFFHAKVKNGMMDCGLDRVILVRPKNLEAMPCS
jgi:CRISPR-associated protein Cas5d